MARKPTVPGRNHIRNTPKAFRSGGGGLNRLICCSQRTAMKIGDALVKGKGVNRSIHSEGIVTYNDEVL